MTYIEQINAIPKLEKQALVDKLKILNDEAVLQEVKAYDKEVKRLTRGANKAEEAGNPIKAAKLRQELSTYTQANEKRLKRYYRLFNDVMEGQLHYVLAFILTKYNYLTFPKEELIQEGALGLHHAIKTFDPEKAQFITYATINIQRKLSDYINRQYSGHIKIPNYMYAQLYKLAKETKRYTKRMGGAEPPKDYLMERLKLSEQEYKNLMTAKAGGSECGNLDDLDRTDLAEHKDTLNTELLEQYVEKLLPKEERIIRHMYLIGVTRDKPASLDEMAKELGLKRNDVKFIKEQAILKLQKIRKNENINNDSE